MQNPTLLPGKELSPVSEWLSSPLFGITLSILAYVFGVWMSLGLFGIGLGAPFASGVAFVVGVFFFLSGKWKRSTIISAQSPADAGVQK